MAGHAKSTTHCCTTAGFDHYSHIFLVKVDAGGLRQLTHGAEVRDTDPTFAPNGKTIACASERADDGTLRLER